MQIGNKIKKWHSNAIILGILLCFGIIYGLISILNHYYFRSSTLDYGVFNQAMYCFSNFKANIFTTDLAARNINFFGDHFSPIVFLLLPFYWIFGSYGLIICQITVVLFSGFAYFKLMAIRENKLLFPILILIHFFCLWSVFSAMAFDFHANVIAACLIPWAIYFYEKRDLKILFLFSILIVACKETSAFCFIFIISGLFIKDFEILDKKWRINLILLSFFSVIYALLVFKLIMPYFLSEAGIQSNLTQVGRYAHLGSTYKEIVIYLLGNPFEGFKLLFLNPKGTDPIYDAIKIELIMMILLAGGVAIFRKISFIWMLFPIVCQYLLTNDYGLWGINYHYSIDYAPIIFYAFIVWIGEIKEINKKISVSVLFLLLTLGSTYKKLDIRVAKWYSNVKCSFLNKDHYKPEFNNLNQIYEGLKLIPDEIPLSVGPTTGPHLAKRNKMYHFPNVLDAEYIALFNVEGSTYPLTFIEQKKKIDEILSTNKFSIIYSKSPLLILKREKK